MLSKSLITLFGLSNWGSCGWLRMRPLSAALIAAISAIAFSQVASAADLGGAVPRAPSPPPPPVANWTGFYLGGDIGAGWANGTNYTFADPGNAAFGSCLLCTLPYQSEALSGGHKSGVLGGVYLGYNWQFAPTWLFGVEGDFTWTDLKQSVNAPLFSDAGSTFAIIPVAGSNLNFETDLKWLATLRGRVGYIVANDWLFYATGGVAWTELNQSANASCLPPDVTNGCGSTVPNVLGTQAPFSASTTRVGFVVGGGLEWQIPTSAWGRWRARVEYLYYGFGATNSDSALFVNVPGGGPLTCGNSPTCSAQYSFGNVNVQTVRFGLSYAF
jgi:outer membrane immunogenic protein